MKYLTIIVVAIMVCIPLVACSNSPDVPMVAFATVTQIEKLQTYIDTGLATKGNKDDVASIIARINAVEQKVNQSAAPNLTNYYTKAEVDAAVAKAITDYKATIVGGTGTQTPSNPTGVTGQVSWQITGTTQQQYQFNPSNMFTIRVINNSSASKYIRPQISVKSYQSMSAGTINPITTNCTVISNSMGQIAPIFTSTLLGIEGNHNGVIFQAYTRGIANGQYFLGSGQVMDFTVNITINSTQSILWTIDLAGSSDSVTQ